ncbi:MAG: hypothetical protein Q8R25_01945, partial [bacterium]|nr:hypothetical protein [bacterium]
MSDEIFFDGVRFISANVAASESNLTRDYIARLCKENKIAGRRIGKNWYVNRESLTSFLIDQEHARGKRRRNLTRERVKEYWTHVAREETTQEAKKSQPIALSQSVVPKNIEGQEKAVPTRVTVSELLQKERALHEALTIEEKKNIVDRVKNFQGKITKAFVHKSERIFDRASHLSTAPAGVAHAALHGAYMPALSLSNVPAHAITPATEVLHKVAALALALVLTFGTYASLNTDFAFFAKDAIRAEVASVVGAFRFIADGEAARLVGSAQERFAIAAEHPAAAASAVQDSLFNGFSGTTHLFDTLARAINTRIDNAILALSSPKYQPPALGSGARGSFAVFASTSQSTQVTQPEYVRIPAVPIGRTIERIVTTERIVTEGGISESILNQRLQELDTKLTSKIFSISAPQSSAPSIQNIYTQVAQSQRLDTLASVDISDSTWTSGTITGATISGASISGGTVAVASLSGTLGIGSGGTGTTSWQTNSIPYFDGSRFAELNSSLSFNGTKLTASFASSTALTVSGTGYFTTASTTNLTWINATGTNSVLTNATSTSLFATLGRFTTAIVDALTGYAVVTAPSFSATSTTATSTFAGALLATRAPTLAHTFSPWITGTANANQFDASLVINPSSATGDSNLISASVNSSVKFLVDAEGDVFVNNLTSVGSVTLSTTSASTFSVEGNTTLGDSITDTTTINGTLTVTGQTSVATIQGKFGVGTTSPFAKLSVHANSGETNPLIFEVASSTASATSSLFSILNTGQIGIGTTSPFISSALQIDSTNKAFLPPRMTTAQKDAISGPTGGLILYDSDLSKLNVYNGSAWKNVGSTEINGEVTSGTKGSVLFVGDGAILGQDNTNFVFSTSTNRLLTTQASTSRLSIFDTAYFGGSATSSFSSTGALTLAGVANSLLWANSSGTVSATSTPTASYFIATSTGIASIFPYASSTALTATNLFSTNGTVTYASSTALTVSGTSFLTNILATASSTIGNGSQAGGLTIFGGATTTGNLVVQGSATSTFSNGI